MSDQKKTLKEYQALAKTLIPNYGSALQYLVQNGGGEFYINLCIDLYLFSFSRGMKYKSPDGIYREKLLEDTENYYYYKDLFPFLPICAMLPNGEDFFKRLKEINSDYVAQVISPDENVKNQAVQIFTNSVCVLFNVYRKNEYLNVPETLKSWPTLLGPLTWIWIHTNATFSYSKIKYPFFYTILKYLSFIIGCSVCSEHWQHNQLYFKKYETLKSKQISIDLIRFHNSIKAMYDGGNKNFSKEIEPALIEDKLNEEPPNRLENFINHQYKSFASKVLKDLSNE